jgi:hypothetical protein
MAEQRRKPGRPLKHVGLSTPASLKQVVDGSQLRDLRGTEREHEGPLLPETRGSDAPPTRKGRVFGTAGSADGVGGLPAIKPAVLDTPGRPGGSEPVTFTELLKQIAQEIAPDEFTLGEAVGWTNMEVLARKVFSSALSDNMGAQRARELVIERLEGKAGRAAPTQGTNTELDDQLDRAAVSALNDLVPDKGDTHD